MYYEILFKYLSNNGKNILSEAHTYSAVLTVNVLCVFQDSKPACIVTVLWKAHTYNPEIHCECTVIGYKL